MAHTPGPWNVGYGAGDQDDYFTILGRDHVAVADYSIANHSGAMSHAEMVANARLIAAPELLRALESVEKLARHALADHQHELGSAGPLILERLLSTASAAIAKAKGGA